MNIKFLKSLKERYEFNAANCRSRMAREINNKRDLKIAEIKERIKFVVNYETDETTVSFRIKDDIDYDYIGQYFLALGFIVIRKTIEELNQEYMLISWKEDVL